MVGTKHIVGIVLAFFALKAGAQVTSGRIVFERKTNLVKRFKGSPMADRFKDQKTKVDMFELLFNDSTCVFKPVESDEQDDMAWATTRNTVYQNVASQDRMSILDLWGNKVYIHDTISKREWKVTDSKRNLAGYECRKAIWQKDDSTRIYAWFSVDIVPSVGPEMFTGLPGAILGLATEDGGIIYFAKEVEVLEIPEEKLTYDVGKNDVLTKAEFRAELLKRFSGQPWGERMIADMFRWF